MNESVFYNLNIEKNNFYSNWNKNSYCEVHCCLQTKTF